MTTTARSSAPAMSQADHVERLMRDLIGCFDTFAVYLGLRLGLYEALAELDRATPTALAAHAGIDERYAREWLEHQAVGGLVEVAQDEHGDRAFVLPSALREVLLDEHSMFHGGPLTFAGAAVASVLPALLDAFRSGGGVAFSDYGPDMRDHIERLNRPMFEHELAASWLPAMPDLEARLRAEPPARILDVACGSGWSTIVLAQAFPLTRVVGIDLDAASIDRARTNAEATSGISDRIGFEVADASDLRFTDRFDVAFIFEALHDLAQPTDALAAIQRALAPGGSVVIGDEKVAPAFVAPGDELERLMYGFSLLHCLPAARTDLGSVATGTVMRPDTVQRYAEAAGFTRFEVVPIEHDMWRFYRLG